MILPTANKRNHPEGKDEKTPTPNHHGLAKRTPPGNIPQYPQQAPRATKKWFLPPLGVNWKQTSGNNTGKQQQTPIPASIKWYLPPLGRNKQHRLTAGSSPAETPQYPQQPPLATRKWFLPPLGVNLSQTSGTIKGNHHRAAIPASTKRFPPPSGVNWNHRRIAGSATQRSGGWIKGWRDWMEWVWFVD